MNQPGNAEQRAAEIAHDNNQHISQAERIDLPEYRPPRAARRFAVVVGAELQAVRAKPVGIAPVPCLVVRLPLRIHQCFHFINSAHGIGIGDEAAAFVFELGFGGRGEGLVNGGRHSLAEGRLKSFQTACFT